jgi:hypothetical protein
MRLMQSLRRPLLPPQSAIEGYESEELVDSIFRKTIAFQARGNWPLVENVTTVLDSGGPAVHYKTACQQSPYIRWAVVETPAMVQRAKELGTDKLMFFERIEEAADWLGNIDLVHSNGAIQYVPDATETIGALCSVRPTAMAWHRVPISDDASTRIETSYLSVNGPGLSLASKEKLVRYERNWIPELAFIQAHEGFRITERSPDPTERGTQQFGFAWI